MPTRLWPLRPAPFADELLTSWIARLAHGHGLRPASFLAIVEPAAGDFAAEAPRATVESLVLRFHPEPGLHDLLHHNGQGPALQSCAACLAQGTPYYRRSWRLACVRVCAQHHAAMRDACPDCGSVVRLQGLPPAADGLVRCQNCGQRLATDRGAPLPRSAGLGKRIDVQRRMARILVGTG